MLPEGWVKIYDADAWDGKYGKDQVETPVTWREEWIFGRRVYIYYWDNGGHYDMTYGLPDDWAYTYENDHDVWLGDWDLWKTEI